GVVTLDYHRLHLRKILDLVPKKERCFDRALAVIFRGPELDTGFQYHRDRPFTRHRFLRFVENFADVAQGNPELFFESHRSLEDWRRTGHAGARQQSRVNAKPGSVRKGHTFPMRKFT